MLLTCFDVLFFEMYFASVNPVVVYLWSKIFVNDACLRELTQPLRSPGLVSSFLAAGSLKIPTPFVLRDVPQPKYSTVIARHFEKIEAEIRKLDLFTSNTNDSIVRSRLWYEVVHGHDHVTCQKWEQWHPHLKFVAFPDHLTLLTAQTQQCFESIVCYPDPVVCPPYMHAYVTFTPC